ncbi:MAG: YfhO family protein, partial [bacterium]
FQSVYKNFIDSPDLKMRIFNSDGIYRSVLSLSNQYLMNGFNLYFPPSYAMSLALLSGRAPEATRPYQVRCDNCANLRLMGLDLLSITHLLCNKASDNLPKNLEVNWYKKYENNEIDLYARHKGIGYLKVFRKWEPINNDNYNLLELANTSLSAFSNDIILINNIGSSGNFDKPSRPDDLNFKRISEGHIQISANIESPAYIFIPENYSEEWNVNINGEKSKLLNAFGGYMAFKLESGISEVELKYRPFVVYISIAISLITLFILITLCFCRKTQITM